MATTSKTTTAKSGLTAKLEEAKVAAEKTASTVKAEAPKKAAEVKTAATKAASTAKKAAAKRTSSKKKEVSKVAMLQFDGKDYKIDDIIAMAEAAFRNEFKRKPIEDVKVYIKPEENAAYYVVTSKDSEYPGRVEL